MHNKIHSHAKLSDVSDYAHQNTFMPWTDDMTYTEENVTPSRVVAYAVGRTDWLSIKYASIKRIISRQQCSDMYAKHKFTLLFPKTLLSRCMQMFSI